MQIMLIFKSLYNICLYSCVPETEIEYLEPDNDEAEDDETDGHRVDHPRGERHWPLVHAARLPQAAAEKGCLIEKEMCLLYWWIYI